MVIDGWMYLWPTVPTQCESFIVICCSTHPLTNDDFRKLLMTPRAPSAKSSAAPTPVYRGDRPATKPKGEDDAFAKRKEKKIYYARLRKDEEERQKKLNEKYRDRVRLLR